MIGEEARGHQHADPPARRGELQHALGEQLIKVGMAASLERVAAGLAAEGRDLARGRPGRIADHRVEPGVEARLAAIVEERLRELELPVEEPFAPRDARRGLAPPLLQPIRAVPEDAPRSPALNAGQLRGVIRSTSAGQNHAAHQASATVRQAASGAAGASELVDQAFLLMDDRRGVVGLLRDAESRRHCRREARGEVVSLEQRQR